MAEELKPSYTFNDDRLNELKRIFPEAYEDGKINYDTLKELIGDFSTDNSHKEFYGLNWVGKQDARRIASKPVTGTLQPCPGEGMNEEKASNIFIEGENLEVLKVLRKSYANKIKLIYIDPPYNTGNDFIYNDTFADSTEDYLRKTGEKSEDGLLVSNPKSAGKFHANWLSFIYPRLKLAKDFLTNDGVIFISIGPDELANLKLVCDEIFGAENCAGICARMAKSGGNKGKYFTPNVEYILTYVKNTERAEGFRAKMDENLIKKVYTQVEKEGDRKGEKYRAMGLYQSSLDPMRGCVNQRYYIESPDGKMVIPPGNEFPEAEEQGCKVAPKSGNDKVWRWTYPKFQEELAKGNIEWKKSSSGVLVTSTGEKSEWNIYTKIWLKEREAAGQLPSDIILKYENRHSSKELQALKIPFDFAKPSGLIKYLIEIVDIQDGDFVLDFFAGSGTTAHAVLNYKSETKKNVNFILVQLPEKVLNESAINSGFQLITDISKKRIKNVLEANESDEGFKVFKLNHSNIYKWNDFVLEAGKGITDLTTQMELSFKNPIVDGVKEQDFITEILLQEGFELTAQRTEVKPGVYKIEDDVVPYKLYVSMLYSFKDTAINELSLTESDHFICLDKAFDSNNGLKQNLDNRCKLFTI